MYIRRPNFLPGFLHYKRLLSTVFFDAYIRYVLLSKIARGSLESFTISARTTCRASELCRLPHGSGGYASFQEARRLLSGPLQSIHATLVAEMELMWVAEHDRICNSRCAAVMIGDGNCKLRPRGCPCLQDDAHSRSLAARISLPFCTNRPRPGCWTCAEPAHRAHEEALRQSAVERSAQRQQVARFRTRGLRRNQDLGCNTSKDSQAVQAFRVGGVFAASFLCGILAPPLRFYISESLTQVAAYVTRLVYSNPWLQLLGYDDWCHLAPFLRRHGQDRVRDLEGFIDRWHQKGHRRLICWATHSADRYQLLWDWSMQTLLTEAQKQCLLNKLRKDHALEVHDINNQSLPSSPRAILLHALMTGHLPLQLSFVSDTDSAAAPQVHVIHVRGEGGRVKVLHALHKKTLRLQKTLRNRGWNVPEKSALSVVAPTNSPPVRGQSQQALHSHLRSTSLPCDVVLRRRRWTSAMERQWRSLNKLKDFLLNGSPAIFDILLLHAVEQHNMRILERNA